MKRLHFLVLVISLLCITGMKGQITGNCNAPYNDATALVNLLVDGVGFSNVTFSGFNCSAGYFDGEDSNIALDAGVVMATGGVHSIMPGFAQVFGDFGVDADLTEQLQIVGASATNLNNLVVLEFDFVPNSDEISFQYVFASNEYPEYTCSEFNDIFGFFLSGPGISGPFTNAAINLALVPDPDNPDTYTNTPVIINTVNSGIPTNEYNDPAPCADIDPNWQDYSVFFTENTGLETVNFPGFTVPLTATASVIPCETYHIKLAIADVSDGDLNSAVFLLENSFSSGSLTIEQESEYGSYIGNDTTLVEGCFNGELEFTLNEQISTNVVVDYVVSGTATNGVDYEAIGTQTTIPAGETEATLSITPLDDGVVEGVESVIVSTTIFDGCFEEERDYIFNIVDRLDLFLDMPADIAFCPEDDPVTIDPHLNGGIYPLTYHWYYDGGLYSDQEEITILPENLGTYSFNAVGLCDSEVSGQIDVYRPEEPLIINATYTDIEACLDDDFSSGVLLSGGSGNYRAEWYLDGVLYSDSINFDVPTDVPYEYNFLLEASDNCLNVARQDFTIDVVDCFVPNVFTPNNDGKNDYWYVNFGDVVYNVRVDIYNRWGQLIYNAVHYELCDEETGDYCWNGENMSTSEACTEGIYYYTIELLDGRKHRGHFNIVR